MWFSVTTSSASTTANVWVNWVNNTTSATSNIVVSSNVIWLSWVTVGSGTSAVVGSVPVTVPVALLVPQPTAAALVARQAADVARQQEAAARDQQRREAESKAMALLRANLSAKQRDDLDKRNWFLVEGGSSKKIYRISNKSCAGNITELHDDQEVARYCVHAEWQIPLGDQLLAQALYLRLNEEYIIGRANKTVLVAAA